MIKITYTGAQFLIYGFALMHSELEFFKLFGGILIIIGAATIRTTK